MAATSSNTRRINLVSTSQTDWSTVDTLFTSIFRVFVSSQDGFSRTEIGACPPITFGCPGLNGDTIVSVGG